MKFLIFTVSSFPKKLFHRNNTSRSNSYSTRILKAFKITDIFCLKPSAIQFISVFLYFFLRFQLLHILLAYMDSFSLYRNTFTEGLNS